MPLYDMPLPELLTYRPQVEEPPDFDDFWSETLAESRAVGGEVERVRSDGVLRTVDVEDVVFPGFGGDPVHAWLLTPTHASGPLPAVVGYLGYGAGRGRPHEHLRWPSAGYVTLVMDTRGQGAAWGTGGDTADPVGSGPAVPGSMTRGIGDPRDYYYRRVLTDAVRAVDVVRDLPQVDRSRVAVAGGSQGGGIALAAAGLVDGLVGAVIDVPFLCHLRRAVSITSTDPYGEVRRYLAVHRDSADRVFRTLSYIDGVSFAARASAPALFSVAMMDPVCPPSTVYAAFNAYAGTDKEIARFDFNEHEGGGAAHDEAQVRWLNARADSLRG